MTSDELVAKVNVAYRIIENERKRREFEYRDRPVMLKAKVMEIERLLEVVIELKQELQARIESEVPVQVRLLDVPRRVRYD